MIRKEAFTCAEEASDILAYISDCQRTLTVGAREEGQVRGRRQRRFEVLVVKCSLTYELFGSTILRFMRRSTDRRDCYAGKFTKNLWKFWVH